MVKLAHLFELEFLVDINGISRCKHNWYREDRDGEQFIYYGSMMVTNNDNPLNRIQPDEVVTYLYYEMDKRPYPPDDLYRIRDKIFSIGYWNEKWNVRLLIESGAELLFPMTSQHRECVRAIALIDSIYHVFIDDKFIPITLNCTPPRIEELIMVRFELLVTKNGELFKLDHSDYEYSMSKVEIPFQILDATHYQLDHLLTIVVIDMNGNLWILMNGEWSYIQVNHPVVEFVSIAVNDTNESYMQNLYFLSSDDEVYLGELTDDLSLKVDDPHFGFKFWGLNSSRRMKNARFI
jgi:hypothetical protein